MMADRSRVFVVVDRNGAVKESVVVRRGDFKKEQEFRNKLMETRQALREKYALRRCELHEGLSDSVSGFLWAYPEIARNRIAK